jgi:hypothetical protein
MLSGLVSMDPICIVLSAPIWVSGNWSSWLLRVVLGASLQGSSHLNPPARIFSPETDTHGEESLHPVSPSLAVLLTSAKVNFLESLLGFQSFRSVLQLKG